MAYWGSIQNAVSARASTADVWAAIRAAQAAEPGGGGGVSVQGVNEVRAAAARLRNASENFTQARDFAERTGITQAIEGTMMSTAPWSREPQVLSTLADYQVRFETLLTTPAGEQASAWVTARFPTGQLPVTVGELIDALSAYSLAFGYADEATLAGIGDVSITAV
jgi:hypothetical protein